MVTIIHKTDEYNVVYKWFDYLRSKGHKINGFVVMPNHVYALITFVSCNQTINTIAGNGKRFMAYEIIKRLKAYNEITCFQPYMKVLRLPEERTRKSMKYGKYHLTGRFVTAWLSLNRNEIICMTIHAVVNETYVPAL